MNYDNFFINKIVSDKLNNVNSITVFVCYKPDPDISFPLFDFKVHEFIKDGYYENNQFIINFLENQVGYDDLTEDDISSFVEHFKNVFLNDFGGFENLNKERNISINEFKNSDFNSLISKREKREQFSKFIFSDEENRSTIFIHYNNFFKEDTFYILQKVINETLIEYNLRKMMILEEKLSDSFDEIFNKVKNMNKYRLDFLFEGK